MGLKLPLAAAGADWPSGFFLPQPQSVSRAVPLESSLVDRSRLQPKDATTNPFIFLLFIGLSSYCDLKTRCNLLRSRRVFMHFKRAGSECAKARSRADLANGSYCCAFVLTMLSPSEFGFSPSVFVVET